jgi:hypothetical protein
MPPAAYTAPALMAERTVVRWFSGNHPAPPAGAALNHAALNQVAAMRR